MKRLRNLALAMSLVLICTSCVTTSPDDADNSAPPTEDLSALDNSAAPDNSLEADLGKDQPAADAAAPKEDEFAQFDQEKPAEQAPPPQAEQPPPPEVKQEPPPPEPAPEFNAQNEIPPEPKPEPPAEAQAQSGLVTLKSLDFKGNDNGGTVVVEADGPMTYSTRMSVSTGQFIVDIPNSILPKKLKHSLVTKDFDGPIGAIDAYQTAGSNVSRVVVHLKPGSPEPVIQAEGSSLLVVANLPPTEAPKDDVKLLSYDSLEAFMAGNMTYSGKKISIESRNIEVADLFRLISDEVGVNLVISDDVKGPMAVKLKQVPWDQALVMVMKAKKLSFTRTGNVLRIAPIAQLRAEEDDMVKLINAKKDIAPLVVKVMPLSYAKVTDIMDQVKPFLSEKRGKVIGDPRTSAIVVSDIQENVDRVAKLIQTLDIPPQQVLIEGKVVEAQDSFARQVGINWTGGGMPVSTGSNSSSGPVNASMGVNVTPSTVSPVTGSLNFQLGTLDVLGSLNAILSLDEEEGLVKVLSSPRVVTLHNEEAVITQTQELPLINSTASNGVVSTNVTFKPVKLSLKVTPNITNDGSVLMKIDVAREFVGQIVDKASGARPFNERSAVTKVLVRNGQTAVIGGIYQDDSTESESRVPWLGTIPILGWLFKSSSKTENKNELLIFVTPRILGQLDSQAIPSQQPGAGALNE